MITRLLRLTLCLPLLCGSLAFSQVVTTPVTPNQAVTNVLVGGGLNVSNISYIGAANALASYTATGTNLPIPEGLIISTGNANDPLLNGAPSNFCSTSNGTPGYAPLTAIAGVTTNDAAVLQFDFIPSGDTLKFDYVFGSEEYNEFVNGGVNDAFAFLITGPNPLGGNYNDQNIALLPNGTVVSINTVNNGYSSGCTGPCNTAINPNCNYYIDNSCGAASGIACDGFTVRLTAIAPVVPCQTYTIKLAIADGGDSVYDSWVFLEKNSFSSNTVTINPNYNYPSAINDTLIYEGCSDVTLTFKRYGDISQVFVSPINISGTATNGVDYNVGGSPFPNSIVFPANVDSVSMTLTIPADGVTEGPETVTFDITIINLCGDTISSEVTLVIQDVEPLIVDAGPDLTRCPGINYTANATYSGGVPPYTVTWSVPGAGGSNPITLPATVSGWCYVTVSEGCGTYTAVKDSFYLTVQPPQFSATYDVDSLSCIATGDGSIITTVTGSQAPFTFLWSTISGGTIPNPTAQSHDSLFAGTYQVIITDANGCEVIDTVQVHQPLPMSFTWAPRFVCSNTDYVLNAPGPDNPNNLPNVNYYWMPAVNLSADNVAAPTFHGVNTSNSLQTFNYTVFYDSTGYCGSSVFTVILNPEVPIDIYPGSDTVGICTGNTITLYNDTTPLPGNPPIIGYSWNTGSADPSITVSTEGWYYLTVADNVNCTNTDSIYVVVSTPSMPNLEPNYVMCEGIALNLELDPATYNPSDQIIWSGAAEGTGPSISVPEGGELIVTINNACGSYADTTNVSIQAGANPSALPNIFTPNGDTYNEVYKTSEFKDSEVFNCKIYNRWGTKVYDTDDKEINWSPKGVSSGVYYVTILYTNCDGKQAKFKQAVTVYGND